MFGVGRESRICSTSHTADWLADEKTQLRPSYLRRKVASFCRETRKSLLRDDLAASLSGGAAGQLAVALRKPGRRSQECCELPGAAGPRQSDAMADLSPALPNRALLQDSVPWLSQGVDEGTISVRARTA
jgi:hypothetical protein